MAKSEQQECPNVPGWLATFGDLMSLLLTFFILLLSFSSIQESKFRQAMGSLLGALGMDNVTGNAFVDTPLSQYATIDDGEDVSESEVEGMSLEKYQDMLVMEELKQKLEDELQKAKYEGQSKLEKMLKLEVTDKGIHIQISDSIFFDKGRAVIRKKFANLLKIVGGIIASNKDKFDIIVEGHTDNTPINTKKFPSNWELSAHRAIGVVRFLLQNYNLPPQMFSARGYGEYRPIVPNNTNYNRSKNRRVEIFLERKKEEN